jgi:DNA-binding Lrp family transcriptional regulator
MDRTDLGIFSRLVTGALRSDEAIGREVGLTGKAVRTRRKRMEATGVLAEYGIHPSAEILGRHALTWRFGGQDRPELPVARLSAIEDLAYVMRFRPNFHIAVRFTKDPDPPNDPRLSRILGPPLEGPPDRYPTASSIHADDLSRVDWKVLESVVRNPRASYSVKAQQAELAPRTLRIHQAKLVAARALACVMILNLEREPGLATYGIWLKVDDSFDERAVELPRLWDRPHWTQNPRGVYLLGSADSYFEAREMELRLRSLPGVVGADPLIPAGGYFARERFLRWIRTERDRRFPTWRRESERGSTASLGPS